MAMQTGSRGSMRVEMNVTPMIDVLLVLLVIFILINPMKKVGYPAELPQENKNTVTPPPERTIVVEVADAGGDHIALRINHADVPERELLARVRDIYKTRAEKVMFLQADSEIEFRKIADVMDIVREADPYVRVGLMTKPAANAD
jgi:biopolymer transport protein TolR